MVSPDLRSEARRLSSGFLLTLCSGPGQTYFIAIFAGHLMADLSITDGQFGGLFTVGTLASAALLAWAGKFADSFPIRWLGVGAMAGLAASSLAMAFTASAWMLGAVLLGLRFFGQGMLTHVAMTAMGRWFERRRGRAVAIAALGFPAAEAVLPMLAVASIGAVGWRQTWAAAAFVLLLVPVPLLLVLLRRERPAAAHPRPAPAGIDGAALARHEWTRAEVLASPVFYALMPALLAQPFVQTGTFFNQVAIVEGKGWELGWFAASFPVLAGVNVLAALAAGWAVDRFGARRLLPAFLLPLGVGTLALVHASSPYILPVFMALSGLTLGSAATIQGALWAELYGTVHLGAIRSIVTAGMVFASALSPALIGFLVDAGIALETQLLAMSIYCFVGALWMGWLVPRLDRIART